MNIKISNIVFTVSLIGLKAVGNVEEGFCIKFK